MLDTIKRPEHQPIRPSAFQVNEAVGKQFRLEAGRRFLEDPWPLGGAR